MATPKTAKKAASARVDAARVLNHLRAKYNPIRNLSPEYLARALDAHERGELKLAAMLWDTIERRDDRTRTVARKRKKAVGRYGWNVVLRDESGRANRHKEAVEFFLTNLVAGDAINGDYRRGWSGLCAQMLDAVGKGRAVHEVLWQPTKDGLSAEFRQVPLWFFESKTGKLRFLESDVAMDGAPLEAGGWMTTVDDGIMEANSIAYLFKVQPLRDWLIFCEKFGIPAVVGKTNAAKGSPEWQALEEAVANFMNDWGAVMNLESAIEFIKAGESSTNLPMPGLVDRCDRVIAALWRGGDLSTMSAQGEAGQGASLQGDEGDILLQDDAELISETLNTQVLPWITRYQFGDEPLVEIQIPIPERTDSAKELEVDKFFLGNGLSLSARDLRERYGRREPDPDDEIVGKTQDGKTQDARLEAEKTEDRFAARQKTEERDHEAGDGKPEEVDELANARQYHDVREPAGARDAAGNKAGGRFAKGPSPTGIGMFSGWTGQDITDHKVVAALAETPEQAATIALSEEIDNALGHAHETARSFGDWATGGEPSVTTIYDADATYDDIRYAMAWKGLAHNQLGVLAFKSEPGGPALMHVSEPVNIRISEARVALDEAGIKFRTIAPQAGGGVRIYVFDGDGSTEEKLALIPTKLNIQFKTYEGQGNFIEGGTRESARDEYLQVIRAYEGQGNGRARVSGGLRERLLLRHHVWDTPGRAPDTEIPNVRESPRGGWRRWLASVVAPLRGFDSPAPPARELSNEEEAPAAVPSKSAELMRAAMAEDAGPLAKAIAEAMWTEDEALMRAKLRLVLARWPEMTTARPEAGRAVWMEILSQAIADGFDDAEQQTKEATRA